MLQLARQRGLKGFVLNNETGVLIEVEGEQGDIDRFLSDLELHAPPLSIIDSIQCSSSQPTGAEADFQIVRSESAREKFAPMTPDIATCSDCLKELFDTSNRRFRFPFINCSSCGPRFTIIEQLPYDRAHTTMRDFVMCEHCRSEYDNPLDRRFHDEPIACPRCGPQVTLTSKSRNEVVVGDVFIPARRLLADGKILAMKGVGGFSLVCDATNASAVRRLRQRKLQDEKPFPLIAGTTAVVHDHCIVSPLEESLLVSPRRPIVLLEKKHDSSIAPETAPGVNTFGFMLPSSPIHHLLLEHLNRPLVIAAANRSDEPICFEDRDALELLGDIADYFFLHNQRIRTRVDDSVTRVFRSREMILKRSRGHVAQPIRIGDRISRRILACGGEKNSTFCLTRDEFAFVSQHLGNLENPESLETFANEIEHYKLLFEIQPEVIAYDLHPDYHSTKYALSRDDIKTMIGVQHHHAHIASCMVDNETDRDVIGVAMDSVGFGADGHLWGCEFLIANLKDAERMAHLEYVTLPTGYADGREPWQMAATFLHKTFGAAFIDLDLSLLETMDRIAWSNLSKAISEDVNNQQISSMGRMFDAVSSLLGLNQAITINGQAGVILEAIANTRCNDSYEFALSGDGSTIKADTVVRGIVQDLLDGVPMEDISAKFHNGVAALITTVVCKIRDEQGINRVALSGGVFENMYLLNSVFGRLEAERFKVLIHSRIPPNDSGISLGQAAIARIKC